MRGSKHSPHARSPRRRPFEAGWPRRPPKAMAFHRVNLETDVLGVGAPIRDADGVVQAALSMAAVASRVPKTRIPRVVEKVRSGADEISEALSLLG